MKFVNRGFITVRPKKAFFEWANSFEEAIEFSEDDQIEPNVYLITEDFFDIEPIIEQNFKKIFESELSAITEESSDWPENRKIETFNEWFDLEIGSMVFDLEKSDLKREEI